MRNYGIAFLVLVVTFYMAMIYENTAIGLLGLSEAVFIVCSICFLWFQSRRLKAALTIPMVLGEKNKPVKLYVNFTNPTGFACTKVKVLILYKNLVEKREHRKWILAETVPVGETKQMYQVCISEAGSFEFRVGKIRIYDLFGIFYLERRMKGNARCIIFPEIHDLMVQLGSAVTGFTGDAEEYDELRPGYDPSETFDVRQFREGDRIQSIHWKLSARMDELMVKEHSLPRPCSVVLILGAGKGANGYGTVFNGRGRKRKKAGDNGGFLEWAISLSFALMDRECAHFLAWKSVQSGEIVRTRVDDEESFYLAITSFLQDCDFGADEPLAERYREKYRGEHYAHILELSGKPELKVDGKNYGLTEFENFELLL